MKVQMLRSLGRPLAAELDLTEAFAEGCVCDLPEAVADRLFESGLVLKVEDAKPVKAKAKAEAEPK